MSAEYHSNRLTTEGSPAHTAALDSSPRQSHCHHTNADFYPVSDGLGLQSGASGEACTEYENNS